MSPLRSTLPLLAMLSAPLPVFAQSGQPLTLLLEPLPVSMLSYDLAGRSNALGPIDVFEVEISESGGITDVFLRLTTPARADLADTTMLAVGETMVISLCGLPVLESVIESPMDSGTIYVPNITALQAEALRAIWQGRDTCATLPSEVFPIAQ